MGNIKKELRQKAKGEYKYHRGIVSTMVIDINLYISLFDKSIFLITLSINTENLPKNNTT